jgi:hypothetical protein
MIDRVRSLPRRTLATALPFALLVGCSPSRPAPDSPPLGTAAPAPVGRLAGTFVGSADLDAGTLRFQVLRAGALPAGGGAIDDPLMQIPDVSDGVAGSGPPWTVELVTTKTGQGLAGCGRANSFCGDVVLRSFYSIGLQNVYAQILRITPPTGNDAYDGDPSAFGLDATFGLFGYGSLGPAGSGTDAATRTWGFNNSGLNFTFYGRVEADLVCAAPGTVCSPVGCVDLATDPMHCGACGTVCPPAQNAVPTCASSTCGFSCNAGFGDCDGNPTNGCEIDLGITTNHCGACNTPCMPQNATGACTGGVCGIGMCNSGFADCNMVPSDGCEVNLLTTAASCGMCGQMCGSGQRCSGGTCVCDGTSCPSGCCTGPQGACMSPGTASCGTGGAMCMTCAASQANGCTGGACTCGGGTACDGAITTCSSGVCKLAKPGPVTAVAGGWRITLSWPAVAGATSYNVLRATALAGPFTAIGSPTSPSFADTTVATGVTYFYEVSAQNASFASDDSTPVSSKALTRQVCVGNGNGQNVAVFDETQTGNVAPLRTIAGAATGFPSPNGLISNLTTGQLFVLVVKASSKLEVFPISASGNIAPTSATTVTGAPYGVDFDAATNELFIAYNSGAARMEVRDATNGLLKRTISGASTQLEAPISVSVDTVHGEVFVGVASGTVYPYEHVAVFNLGDSGNVAPKRALGGPNHPLSGGGWGVAVDTVHGELATACGCTPGAVNFFPLTATGDIAPPRSITGASTGLHGPTSLMIDSANDTIWVTNGSASTGSVVVLPRSGSGNVAPLQNITGTSTTLNGSGVPIGLAPCN